jgi:pimeloyl-ACP methyl ester carboxylesterase
MATAHINGVRLFYDEEGAGEPPLVLVHASWASHHTWDRVVPGLAESFRVIRYDRRGHSQSERPSGQGSIYEDVEDLGALIEHLEVAPVWVAGSSSGAQIALRLAGERPELLQGIIAHEPGFFKLLRDDPTLAPMLDAIEEIDRTVATQIGSGDHAGATEKFIEHALGPGSWERLPLEFQQMLVENAPTFMDEVNDPEFDTFDVDWITGFSEPILLTLGDQSPPFFAPVVARLAEALPHAEVHTFAGAGHTPHNTHPDDYVKVITAFVRKHS